MKFRVVCALDVAETELAFPRAALTVLCFAVVPRKMLIPPLCFGISGKSWHSQHALPASVDWRWAKSWKGYSIPYRICSSTKVEGKDKEKGLFTLHIVSWRNLYAYWSPALQEAAERHLLVGNWEQNAFSPLLSHSWCFYFIKLFLFWPTRFSILFSVSTTLLRRVLGGHLASVQLWSTH